MKKILSFLILLFLGAMCFSQTQEKLPRQPWTDILEMNSKEYFPIQKWDTDINVKLEGIYTEADSLKVAQIVKKLDALTETISIKFSKTEDPNFRIHFLNKLVKDENNVNNTINTRYGSNYGSGYSYADVYVYTIDKSDIEVRNSLESRLTETIVNGSFIFPMKEEKRNSIFNPVVANNNSNIPLNNEDIAIIKEVYGKNYEDRLKIAKKQFPSILRNLRNEKISQRERSIWWVKNPISVLILPAIILFLGVVFLIKKTSQALSSKIKNDWLGFGVISFIALLFADIVIILLVSFYDFLTIPDEYQKIGIFRKDTILTTTLTLFVLVFPFLFLLRFLELKISMSSQKILTKTVLMFLSTGFIPFVIVYLLMYFSKGINGNDDYYVVSNIFLYIMIFASIRAFISYFIFKERSLIVENEMQLSHLRELKTKAELKSLQSRVNPHFLYNSLNSIAGLAHDDADKTEKMALSLSDLFRYSINKKGEKMSTVNEEVTLVENYLEIEKIRFGERLVFTLTVDDAVTEEKIPMFMLQPLLENAIKHGVSKIGGEAKVSLDIKKDGENLLIAVSDNGPHFPKGLVSGHGLQTVYDLLRLSYGNNASLSWENAPKKQIVISIKNNQHG